MSIYKRKDTWWIQYTAPNGSRIQQTAGTQIKQEAQELHDHLKAEGWRVKNLGSKPRHTWQEAVIRWLTEQGSKKSIETDKVHLRWLNQHLNNTKLDEINKVMVDQIKQAKQQTGVSNSTVNRVLAILRAILHRVQKMIGNGLIMCLAFVYCLSLLVVFAGLPMMKQTDCLKNCQTILKP